MLIQKKKSEESKKKKKRKKYRECGFLFNENNDIMS